MTQSGNSGTETPIISEPGRRMSKGDEPDKNKDSSVKETLESILVAFILAFIFRAFVVEAFVIPTGSMAPTLLGAHMRFHCNDCGYRFTANYSAPSNRQGDLIIKDTADIDYHVYCPNCGYRFPMYDPTDPDNDGSKPPVHYGDRILVLKYLYLFEKPQRWDVVVFKSPANDDPTSDKPTYQQNYIKRLIGRPGESIMILDGDIYMGKAGEPLESYQIQNKPRYAQEALWRVIYDNDFYPQGKERDGETWKQPWTVRDGSGWTLGDKPENGRAFHFDNASGESTLYFNKDANRTNYAFTDWLAYDVDIPPAGNQIHDLKLAFFYERGSGEGPLKVTLRDGQHRAFRAELTPGQSKLFMASDQAGEQLVGSANLPKGSDPLRVEMTNVDYKVTFRVNDHDLIATTPEQYHPDVARLLEDFRNNKQQDWPAVEIAAANQAATLSHVGLWRDVYYLNRDSRFDNPPFYASPKNPANLGAGEYFVMGDNSLVSSDARYWRTPIDLPADRLLVQAGRVPDRFMLGRAFFVYWPAGFRPANGLPALSPDFGDMRFIR
jgi:signal peptidase I